MAGTLWFYVKDDKRLGPVDFEQLVGLLLGGQLRQTALVWHQGLREWMSADHIPEIAEQLPPPLPPGKSPRSTLIMEASAVPRTRMAPAESAAPAAPTPPNPRVEELRRRLEKDPSSRVFAQLAEELRKEGEFEDAIRVSRDGLEKHPFYPSARMTLGRALFDSKAGLERSTKGHEMGHWDLFIAQGVLEHPALFASDNDGPLTRRSSPIGEVTTINPTTTL